MTRARGLAFLLFLFSSSTSLSGDDLYRVRLSGPPPPSRPRSYLTNDEMHVFSGHRVKVPAIPTAESYRGNIEMMRALARENPKEATRLWINAVWPDGEPRPSMLLPSPNAAEDPRWDYKVVAREMTQVYSPDAEDAGNVNFYLTGVATFTAIAEKAGLSGKSVDLGIEWLIRVGGGAAQVAGDLQHGRWRRVDRTFYGEEEKDARVIDQAREYGRFLELERIARSVGIRLDPQDFGITEFEPPKRSLLLHDDQRFRPREFGRALDHADEEDDLPLP